MSASGPGASLHLVKEFHGHWLPCLYIKNVWLSLGSQTFREEDMLGDLPP